MTYFIKEIYYTLQGEGAHSGRAAVICRFAGCNLWSGYEDDRSKAICNFCDTNFVDNIRRFAKNEVDILADTIATLWPWNTIGGSPYVICTGGEPLLQLDKPLCDALHANGFEIGVETNGTILINSKIDIDWLCVSPKANTTLLLISGNELKLIYPQKNAMPELFVDLSFTHFFLQPMDGPDQAINIQSTTTYCLKHPKWKLSLQLHKIVGIS
ncbi:MAG: 7-carboxy-7-deazaguanine synthase [Rhodospirillaceae bacterium]|jgi:7-carboxy-7-deazaguanine synthase (Cx14CxxC type)|nr:7-carboxy-7-deazaguanine synthase [Rhodospirillaceae bacterium]